MGCACGKPSAIEDIRESPREPPAPGGATALVAPAVPAKLSSSIERLAAVPRREAGRRDAEKEEAEEAAGELSARRRRERALARGYHPRLSGSLPRAAEGEQVAAGWPAWLANVAGEAIRGWVPRRADSFEKLDKIGQGTYSNVYRARDLDNGKIVALKKVRFDNLEPESVRFMAREIHILRRLDHPNVIKLEGLVTSRMSCSLYLVFEYMEHDLAGLASCPGLKFTEPQIKCYMQQLLQGLDHCHNRNILHRDIKGSNLLIDNNGILKIADFGLASFFDPDQNHSLTSRVVTLWYRPPELLLGATNYGVSVDLWSSGCILAELYAGSPIMPGRTEVEQLHKIFKLCGSPSEDYWKKSKLPHATIFKPQQPYRRCITETFKDFPAPTLGLISVLLAIDPSDRGSAASALSSEFFTTKPFACDPSSLPRYPPSKELDAKVRDEEARRLRAAGRSQRSDLERKVPKESRAVPAPDANAELPASLQKRHAQSNPRSRSEKFNPQHEEVASGFPIEPPRHVSGPQTHEDSQGPTRISHSGPLAQRSQWPKVRKNEDDGPRVSLMTNSSSFSGSATAFRRNLLPSDGSGRVTHADGAVPSGRLSESCNGTSELSRKYDQLYRSRGLAGSHPREEERTNKEQTEEYESKSSKIHYSGPLLRPSGNADQMLKDHDRHIQEVFRRSRLDKSKARRTQVDGGHARARPCDLGGAPLFPSSRGAPVFQSGRGAAV